MSALIHEEVDRVLRNWGTHPVLIETSPGAASRIWTAHELQEAVAEAARFLRETGLARGQAVALFLDNSADFICLFLALSWIGAIPVPLKPEYRRLELEEIFSNSRPAMVITEEAYLPALSGCFPGITTGRTVIVRTGRRMHVLGRGERLFESVEGEGEIASLNYTWRGIGIPLGVLITHDQYLDGARMFQENGMQGEAGRSLLVILPMNHIFTLVGCLLVPLLYRMTMVIPTSLSPRFLFEVIRNLKVNYLNTVPEFLLLLQRLKDHTPPLSSLEVVVSGGSRISKDDHRLLQEAFGVDLIVGYGLTEHTPISGHARGQIRIGTLGPLRPGVECRLRNPDPAGMGEICVRVPHPMAGYHRRSAETAAVMEDGWLRTGDLGRLEDGQLVFERELKDTRKINGMMVDLEEVRRALRLHPLVEKAEVRIQDGILTSEVRLKKSGNGILSPQTLRKHLVGTLSSWKIPKLITIKD